MMESQIILFHKNSFTPFKHDIHVCVFIAIYMFVKYFCIKYIKACIHQGLNPRSHGYTLRFQPPNHFTKPLWDFMQRSKSLNLSCLAWNCLVNSNFNIHFFYKMYSMLQMKISSWSLFNNVFKKIIIIYNNGIYNVKKYI